MRGGGEVRGRDKIRGGEATPLCLFIWGRGGEREAELLRCELTFGMLGFAGDSPDVMTTWLWGCVLPPTKTTRNIRKCNRSFFGVQS